MDVAQQILGSTLPIMSIIAFSVPLLDLLTKRKDVSWMAALAASLVAAAGSVAAYVDVVRTGRPVLYLYGGWPPSVGIVYEIDPLNALLGLFTALVMLTIVAYSRWYSRHLDEPQWYYALLIGLEIGLLGCYYTGDAFNLFVMIEVLSISAYGLVAYHKERAEAVEAAAKYALIGAVATGFYFIAVVLLYAGYGTVNMGLLAYLAAGNQQRALAYIALLSVAMALWVFTYKSALFPNHFWLPDAHPEAPTPVSAALSGLLVNVGVYATARFLYTIFGPTSALAGFREAVLAALFVLGAAGSIVGALMMMLQSDIKRLLAYSTVSHMGIAYLGVAAGFLGEQAALAALTGAVIHMISHGISKAALFMSSGIFIDAAGTRNLDGMRGIGREHPLASAAMLLGFLNLAGLLPFLGFFSKLQIAYGYIEGGFALGAVVVIIASALAVPGYMRAIYSVAFAVGGAREGKAASRGSWVEAMLLAMCATTLALGAAFAFAGNAFNYAAWALSPGGTKEYVEAVIDSLMSSLGTIPR
ncbi:MAG: proton-conducting transporter membrane subunit [Desulfurococcaceae archaeon]